jgi:4-hydroxy-2-oxoheptanedioate aldolase
VSISARRPTGQARHHQAMRVNPLRHQLINGASCRGVWLSLPSTPAARLLASLSADWYVLDAEHSPMGIETMTAMVAAVADIGCPVMVRVQHNRTEYIKWALDAGAAGIIAPMVNTVDEAAQVVQAAKYPPMGARSHGSAWAGLPFELSMTDYQHHANQQTMCLVQIESALGLANAHGIAAVPGLDGLFVGPVDLAISLASSPGADIGIETALAELAHVGKTYGLPIGIYCRSAGEVGQRIEQGYQLVIVASDVAILMDGVRNALDLARRWLT